MRVKFNGEKNVKRTSGCSSCAKRRVSSGTFQREKSITMPSGIRKRFFAGNIYDVVSHDGLFLIGLRASDGSKLFEEMSDVD